MGDLSSLEQKFFPFSIIFFIVVFAVIKIIYQKVTKNKEKKANIKKKLMESSFVTYKLDYFND